MHGKREYLERHRCLMIFIILIISSCLTRAQDLIPEVTGPASKDLKGISALITHRGYGGPAIKISSFNNQVAFMTGGRGACTLLDRYTIGGGGYGIANFIKLPGSGSDTISSFKMGYGGPEIGYIFLNRGKLRLGGSFLLAAGAAFSQSKPKGNNNFRFLPVLEPSVYGERSLNSYLWLQAGISYRYISRNDFLYPGNMRGFSAYVAILFGR